jgi:hypothetical protein
MIPIYFILVSLKSLSECLDDQCVVQRSQAIADGLAWGYVYVGCTVLATVLAILATERSRLAAGALVAFASIVATTACLWPSDLPEMQATAHMAFALGPLVLMAMLRWWSLGTGPLQEAAGALVWRWMAGSSADGRPNESSRGLRRLTRMLTQSATSSPSGLARRRGRHRSTDSESRPTRIKF